MKVCPFEPQKHIMYTVIFRKSFVIHILMIVGVFQGDEETDSLKL